MSALLERLRSALSPHYRVERLLGAGGMASVFLARDVQLDRPVAVKVLRPELATAAGAERFLQEARLLARLRHPHVVTVHEVGTAEGLYFYVMDYVQGESLRHRLQQGPLPEKKARELGVQLLEALGVAHQEGVVHRDVKPENVFLGDGRVILADFGVARDVSRDDGHRLTSPEQRPGTPGYMAPEQAAGEEATPRSDLYAAGMVLYEVLAGRKWPPFRPPDGADWEGVPPSVVPVLSRALEPDPEDRWPDARSFAAALASTTRRTGSRPVQLVAASALVALAVGGVLLLGDEGGAAGENVRPADLAILPCEALPREDSSLARDLAYLAARNLETVPDLRIVRRSTAFRWWNAARHPDGSDAAEGNADVAEGAPDAAEGARALGASLATRCLFLRHGDSVTVELELVAREGGVRRGIELRGEAPTSSRAVPDRLASQLAVRIAAAVAPRLALTPASFRALEGHPSLAWHAFLRGEAAYERNDWTEAERHYADALTHDSSFALARWRMADVHRWLQKASRADIEGLCREIPGELGPADRQVLEARCLGHGPRQIEAYRRTALQFPDQAYAVFSYGDELFHRGPLWGVGDDSAASVLATAARRDSFFAPTLGHLAWAEIRRGRSEVSRRALDHLLRIGGGDREAVYGAGVLRLAWLERFDPAEAARHRQEVFGGPGGAGGELLTRAVRWGLAFDLPAAQLDLARQLGDSAPAGGEERLSASVAAGAALVALGRPAEARVHFDFAARIAGSPDAALQAAEWTVIPAALDLLDLPIPVVDREARRMADLLERGELSPDARARAATALALLALRSEGTEQEIRRWEDVLEVATAEGASPRHRALLGGFRRAAARDYAGALTSTRQLLAYDSAGRTRRPFHRATFYLGRGQWFARLGRSDSARASWRWHRNVDAAGKLTGLAQSADVDWALAPYARLRSARLALAGGHREAACADAAAVLRYWRRPEAVLGDMVREARRLEREACER